MPNDDFEIEIIDLDMLPEESAVKAPGDSNDHNDGNEAIQQIPVRVSLRSKLTPRQRVIRVIGLAVVVIVSLTLILNGIAPVHSLLGLLVGPTPASIPMLTPDSNHFYLDASPPWGKLSLDGHPLAFSTVEPVQLPPGLHQFVWQAQPFHAIRCTLSVPVSATDTCKHFAIASPLNGSSEDAQEVMFYDTLNMLPTTQQAALILAAQAGLDAGQSTTTVQPGEQFVHFVGSRSTEVTTRPLHATLHYDLSVGNANLENSLCADSYNMECDFLHRFQAQDVTQSCAWFCTEPDTYTSSPVPDAWRAVVIAHAYWDYATLDGRTVATDQPDTILDLTNSAHFVFLTIAWDGTNWHAAINMQEAGGFNTLACLAAASEFSEIPPPVGLDGYGFSSAATTVSALGCVEIVQPTAAAPSAPAPSSFASPPQALCLYRFGIILAANALAHHYWPHMPIANAYEQLLARQLAAMQPTG